LNLNDTSTADLVKNVNTAFNTIRTKYLGANSSDKFSFGRFCLSH